MKTNKLGIIGCGKQAEKHIGSLRKVDGADIVVADIDPRLAQALSRKCGVSFTDSVDELFDMEGLGAILVCTPTPTHADLIRRGLESGRRVFCEKPVCTTRQEAVDLRRLEERSGGRVVVGYLYRHVPAFQAVRRLLDGPGADGTDPPLGRPLTAAFRIGGRGSHQVWKHIKAKGGGAINEMLVHMLDLAGWFFGPMDRQSIEVPACRLLLPVREIGGRPVEVDAEDYVVVRMRSKGGVEILYQADLITPAFSQYVEIQGENGSLMASIQADMPSFIYLKEARAGFHAGRNELASSGPPALDRQMEAFVNGVRHDAVDPTHTLADSIELMETLERIRTLQGE